MEDILGFLKSRFGKGNSNSDDIIMKTKVKNVISDLCDKHLNDVGDVFVFEVSEGNLPYAIMVIDEEPLKSKYIINQIDKTLFEATLQELEI